MQFNKEGRSIPTGGLKCVIDHLTFSASSAASHGKNEAKRMGLLMHCLL